MASLLDAIWQVETGNKPGVRGPVTKYGQPLGIGQTLIGTAREMAQKLGLPWRPDMLTATSPAAVAYQKAVSEAYYNEGLERTGNTRDALRYYHGGPNRRLWGPKTNAYADKVLGLAGGDNQQMPINLPGTISGYGGGTWDIDGGQRVQRTPIEPDGRLEPANQTSLASILADLPDADPVQKPKAFDQGGKGWVIAGIIADALAKGFGGEGQFAPTYLHQQEANRQERLYREKVALEREDRLRPKLEQVGDTIGMVDPRTGAFNPTYQAPAKAPQPTNAARMLIEQGIMPGTPEFNARMRRYMERPLVIDGQPFGYADGGDSGGDSGRSVVRTGVDASGRRVVQYNDGTIDYAD